MDILNSMKAKIAFIFPGQGSQYVGMGKQLYDASPAARRIFQQADAILGFPLSTLCFEGPQAELDDTFEFLKEHKVELDKSSKKEDKFKVNNLEAEEISFSRAKMKMARRP